MRTRKIFIHEDGVYEGVSRLPEPRENQTKQIIAMYDSYDWYPEKDAVIKPNPSKFEGIIDLPLGEEYKLQPQIDIYKHNNHYDAIAIAALNEEINNMVVK